MNDAPQDDDRHEEDALPQGLEGALEAAYDGGGAWARAPRADNAEEGRSILDHVRILSGAAPRVSLRDPQGAADSPMLRPLIAGEARATGKYVVQGELGRGGVGAVHKGHDQELGRDVAMKFLHDRYRDEPTVLHRFVEEAQIGGQLQHPGIVPVYDLGMSDGRPFFTMKLVKGQTLAKKLASRSSPRGERMAFLSIFEAVCQTMAYAHARGVVHRDLKPANVMIGSFGEVQVVDWGMGKVMRQGGVDDERRAASQVAAHTVIATARSSGHGSQSIVGSVMGTPAYMPPEQARGDVEAMDERSDVFALGAILCEILTGAPPYVGESGKLIAMAAMAKLDDATERLDACGAEPDLVELAKRCLMPAPAARPANAEEVATEVHEHLERVEARVHEARVEAAEARGRAASLRRTQRMGIALTVVIAAGLGVSLWFWNQADEQRRAAEEQREIALAAQAAEAERAEGERLANEKSQRRLQEVEKASELLASIFDAISPEEIAAEELPLQEVLAGKLEAAAARTQADTFDDPVVAATLQTRLGAALRALGRTESALALVEQAHKQYDEHLGPDDERSIEALGHLATVLDVAGENERAIALLEETLRRAESNDIDQKLRIDVRAALGAVYQNAGQSERALPLLEAAVADLTAAEGPDANDTIRTQTNLAVCYRSLQRHGDALRLLQDAAELVRAKRGLKHPVALYLMSALIEALGEEGRHMEARRLAEEAFEASLGLLGPGHPVTKTLHGGLATARREAGDVQGAIDLFASEAGRLVATYGAGDARALRARNNLAAAYWSAGRFDDAVALLEKVVSLAKASIGDDHPTTLMARTNLGVNYIALGRDDEARPLLLGVLDVPNVSLPGALLAVENLLEILPPEERLAALDPRLETWLARVRAMPGDTRRDQMKILMRLGILHFQVKRYDEAAAYYKQAAQLSDACWGPKHQESVASWASVFSTYQVAARESDARRAAAEVLRRFEGADLEHPTTQAILGSIARCYATLGRQEEGIELLQRVMDYPLPPYPLAIERRSDVARELAHLLQLGERMGEARDVLRVLVDLDTRLDGPQSPRVAVSLCRLAAVLSRSGQEKEAREVGERAAGLHALKPEAPEFATYDAEKLLSVLYLDLRRADDAERHTLRELELGSAKSLPLQLGTLSRIEGVADLHAEAGRHARAIGLCEQSVKRRRELQEPHDPDFVEALCKLGLHRGLGGDEAGMRAAYEEAAELYEGAPDKAAFVRLNGLNLLVGGYLKLGRPAEAAPLARRELELTEAQLGWRNPRTLQIARRAAGLMTVNGSFDEAIPLMDRVRTTWIELGGPSHPETLFATGDLGWMLFTTGRVEEAHLHLALVMQAARSVPAHRAYALQFAQTAFALIDRDHVASDVALLREVLTWERPPGPVGQDQQGSLHAILAHLLLRLKQAVEAEQQARACIAIRERLHPEGWPLHSAQAVLGRALLAQGRLEDAEPVLRKAAEALLAGWEDMPKPARPRVAETLEALVATYGALGRKEEVRVWRARLEGLSD